MNNLYFEAALGNNNEIALLCLKKKKKGPLLLFKSIELFKLGKLQRIHHT